MTAYFLLLTAGILSTIGNILIKEGINQSIYFNEFYKHPYIFVGLIAFAVNLILFIIALKTMDVSRAYPILACISFITLQAGAFFFLDEATSILKLIGISLIILGLLVLVGEGLASPE
jgi:multidrug transporter EmrE-like cation transporter